MRKTRLFFFLLLLVLPASCSLQGVYEATTPVPREDQRWVQLNEHINALAKQGNIDLVFLGDSITEMWAYDQYGKTVWDKYYGERNAANFGIGGDRTQHVLWRIENGNFDGIDPKLIVLLIGTNNLQYNSSWETAAGIFTIVKILRRMKPQTKILLLGIFPRGMKADDPFRAEIKETNNFIKCIADGRNIVYLDIGNLLLEDSGDISTEIMPDYLHLSTIGYQLWADAQESLLEKMLNE
jgi:lysophospholipase L1-like esterase